MTMNCKIHPSEAVKYFCKDDQTALCPECVVEHARHDFIMANDNASRQVKDKLQEIHIKVESDFKKYQKLYQQISANRAELVVTKQQQIKKIEEHFKQLRDIMS